MKAIIVLYYNQKNVATNLPKIYISKFHFIICLCSAKNGIQNRKRAENHEN